MNVHRHQVVQNSLYRYTVQIRYLFLGAIFEREKKPQLLKA